MLKQSVKLPPRSPNMNAHAEEIRAQHKRILSRAADSVWGKFLADSRSQLVAHYNYASYCPPRYVIDKSKNAWFSDANAGVRFRVLRSSNWAAATVSSARQSRIQGPAVNGCTA